MHVLRVCMCADVDVCMHMFECMVVYVYTCPSSHIIQISCFQLNFHGIFDAAHSVGDYGEHEFLLLND